MADQRRALQRLQLRELPCQRLHRRIAKGIIDGVVSDLQQANRLERRRPQHHDVARECHNRMHEQ